MKAAVFEGVKTIRTREIAEPRSGPDDVVLAVRACGICGSDLHSYTTGAFVSAGQVMGHEFSGEVIDVGADVRGISLGDRVTAMPSPSCFACPACARGDYHLCYAAGGHSIAYGLPGAFAERVRVPRATLGLNVFALPDAVSDLAGATVEPLSVALHAVEMARPDIGARVVVIGAGLIGQCVIQVLAAAGVTTIVATEVSTYRAERARRSGAHVVLDPTKGDVVREIAGIVGVGPSGRGAAADVVFDCAGVPAALAQALKMVRPGGTLALTALYEEPVSLDPNRVVWREMRIVGTYGYRNEFPRAIELLRSGKVATEPLVTDRLPLDETDAGFRRQLDKNGALKVVIQP